MQYANTKRHWINMFVECDSKCECDVMWSWGWGWGGWWYVIICYLWFRWYVFISLIITHFLNKRHWHSAQLFHHFPRVYRRASQVTNRFQPLFEPTLAHSTYINFSLFVLLAEFHTNIHHINTFTYIIIINQKKFHLKWFLFRMWNAKYETSSVAMENEFLKM